ncbi:MAG TPA: uroporphyrinogen-III synthase [Campylobacterales bacterium]|nr:uroporphyrinogen-III synthase [Campylobacterales bacterium]
MIRFQTTVHEIDFGFADLLLFTSKQAVTVTDQISQKWKKFPCIAVGSATQERIEALGGKVLHVPEAFYGEALAKDLIHYFHDKKILYLRPKKTAFDIKGAINAELTVGSPKQLLFFETVIYRTLCKNYTMQERPPENSVIIFTSPSTIKCFWNNFSWDESYTAVVIGTTTAKHLPKACKYVIAEQPLITSCIEKAKEITRNSDI